MSTGEAEAEIPAPFTGSWTTHIGSAFISIIEPALGHEREYNRWYEDDHFVGAAMSVPWFFAGRRWVATKRLQGLRYPQDSSLIQPIDAGLYMHNYWIASERWNHVVPWIGAMTDSLLAEGRITEHQHLVHNAFHEYVGAVYRDGDDGPRDIHALNYPYEGIVCEFIHAPTDAGRDELVTWLREQHIPKTLAGSPAAMCLVFEPMRYPPEIAGSGLLVDHADIERRVALLWFLETDPESCWSSTFAGLGQEVEDAGMGRVEFCAPFIPVVHGTDRYVDELR